MPRVKNSNLQLLFMDLPWSKKEKIEELEEEIRELNQDIEGLKEEKDSFKQRFEAEKERRSELSRKKQEAEKELKELKKRRERSRESGSEKSVDDKDFSSNDISLEKTKRVLKKLGGYESPEKDLITVQAPESLQKLADTQGLKNSISKTQYNFISDEGFIAFIDPDLMQIKLKSRPFFKPKWSRDSSFDVSAIKRFISEEKQWAVVSAGDTKILKEKNGEIIEREEVTNRIERKQKKGGFSQGRFERKRQEQIDEHVDRVEEKISDDALLVGEERLCKRLSGEFLGGFDSSRNLIDALYGFRMEKMKEV